MDNIDFANKANQAFYDREAYIPIADDPTKKQAASVKKKVNELTRRFPEAAQGSANFCRRDDGVIRCPLSIHLDSTRPGSRNDQRTAREQLRPDRRDG
ncbi:unnamed protein product [Schistocephalus solidus]|uniref:Dynein_attach_N domain-containing protein n=1 Tax=Schistocephalus solidus TaxID=70667 RepID=A0A183TJT7_SCHSO|nr:unnamed protein product [Schistocephalus solidus]